jgi:transcriptional regulator with XRE-family HTH domain
MSAVEVGPLLKGWRERRRLSQLELASTAGVSARHLSFVETGRSRPGREMLVRILEQLEVPFRQQNRLLLASGHAPAFPERSLEDPDLLPVREALDQILTGHEPYPAVVVDRHWGLVAGNRAVALLMAGVAAHLLEPPVNVLRLSLHPEGLAPRILNLAEWRAHLLDRLSRQAVVSGDPALFALHEELAALPGGSHGHAVDLEVSEIAVPLRVSADGAELAFISTATSFGTATEVTASELAIESFFPADEHTARFLRAWSEQATPPPGTMTA